MNEVSRLTKELARAGRVATRPSATDRARVTEALRARLGDGALAGVSATSLGSLWSRSFLWKGMTVAVLCGLGSAAYLGLRAPSQPATSLRAQSALSPAARDPSEQHSARAELEPAPAPSSPNENVDLRKTASTGARTAGRSPDRLAEEVAILSRAEAELHRGQAALALRGLDEHQRKFPKGSLTLERRAARARALCALGRADEARAELKRLSRVAFGSSLEARAREACGALVVEPG